MYFKQCIPSFSPPFPLDFSLRHLNAVQMSFPKPPTLNGPAPTPATVHSPAPVPVPAPRLGPEATPNPFEPRAPSGRLSDRESSLILRSTLLPEHHDDPAVLRFISNYLICRDARQAAREAGLNARSGVNLRARPDIHLAITKLTEKSVMKYGYDATEVIEKVKEIAAIDPIEFENPDGSFKAHMKDIAPESRRAIKKFKAKNLYEKDPNGMPILVGQLIEVELWDKMKAVELLGREKDIFVEKKKIEHDVTSNMASVLLEGVKRAEDRLQSLKDARVPTIEIEGRVPSGEDT